jgi:hypothetical protein
MTFLSGMVAMGFLIASLFFVSFWRRTGDTLFMVFGVAFFLMALNQALPILLDISREEHSWFYLLRLLAYTLIVVAIVRKSSVKPT